MLGAPRPGSVLKLREGERQKPEALTSSHILKTLLFFSKVKNVAASLTWPQHRRRVSVAPPLRCASPVPLRDTSCPVACRSPARVSPAAPLGDGSPENHNLAKLRVSRAVGEGREAGRGSSCPSPDRGGPGVITLSFSSLPACTRIWWEEGQVCRSWGQARPVWGALHPAAGFGLRGRKTDVLCLSLSGAWGPRAENLTPGDSRVGQAQQLGLGLAARNGGP